MPVLPEAEIANLLSPYLSQINSQINSTLLSQLSGYLDLLVRWNARTNLTAIRTPEEMVSRHFGESLFAAQNLGDELPETLLDFGSGAGFPGVPIALFQPTIAVTLAESQNKKATFLREVVRTLGLANAEVWMGRAEGLPESRMFHTVGLRAVDKMEVALGAAAARASRQVILLSTSAAQLPQGFVIRSQIRIPESESRFLVRAERE
jgi:16S rRNA (guanine527-N7)-methyltransferase